MADFVLCQPDLSIVAVIELDDWSHKLADRPDADARKTKALTDAGLRLIRIPDGPIPSPEVLKRLIDLTPAGFAALPSSTPGMAELPHLRLVDPEPVAALDQGAADEAWRAHKAVWSGGLKLCLGRKISAWRR